MSINISIVTNHEKRDLSFDKDDTIINVLIRNSIPWSAVTCYLSIPNEPLVLFTGLASSISMLPEECELIFFYQRNIDPFKVSLLDSLNNIKQESNVIGSEYIYQDFNNSNSSLTSYLKKLSPSECKQIVKECIYKFIESNIPPNAKIVVGISGGGDSNALLHGLCSFDKFKIEVIPVIIKGCIDWDMGVPRAVELCHSYDLPLRVVNEEHVAKLLGFEDLTNDFVGLFEKQFPGDDFEFLGTMIITMVLNSIADEIGTSFKCTGLNLEDLLADCFNAQINNKPIPQLPIRLVGNKKLIFPLWLCPKKIIDGCFPKYSKANYDNRYPCVSLGRTLFYQMTYSFQSQYPGCCERLLQSYSQISNLYQRNQYFDDELKVWTSEPIPLPLKHRILKLRRP